MLSATRRSLMVVALLYEMQTPCNCFTLSLCVSDSCRSNSWRDDNLMLPWLSLPLSDKVKHYRAIALHTIKRQPYGSCQLPITVTKHDHLIQQFISHHVLTISHHNMPCKNKFYTSSTLLLQVLRGCYGLLARTVLTYASKPQRFFVKCAVLTFNKDRP